MEWHAALLAWCGPRGCRGRIHPPFRAAPPCRLPGHRWRPDLEVFPSAKLTGMPLVGPLGRASWRTPAGPFMCAGPLPMPWVWSWRTATEDNATFTWRGGVDCLWGSANQGSRQAAVDQLEARGAGCASGRKNGPEGLAGGSREAAPRAGFCLAEAYLGLLYACYDPIHQRHTISTFELSHYSFIYARSACAVGRGGKRGECLVAVSFTAHRPGTLRQAALNPPPLKFLKPRRPLYKEGVKIPEAGGRESVVLACLRRCQWACVAATGH